MLKTTVSDRVQKTKAELEAESQRRGYEADQLAKQLIGEVVRFDNLLKLSDACHAKALKLRKNLYGILNTSSTPKNLDGLLGDLERKMVKMVSDRYSMITVNDLADVKQLQNARSLYNIEGEIEIDDDAIISDAGDQIGVWLQAWVYVLK